MFPDGDSVIAAARNQYFDEGRLPSDRVGHAVLRSWIRCSDMGFRERATPAPEPLSAPDLRHLHEQHQRFTCLCRPELELLNADAHETGSVVILTDATGMILDTLGDTAFVGRAAQVALRPGVDWSEAKIGTNAIGVALAERRAVAVHGGEHFFSGHQVLSCAATPILDPRGAVLGVLDISGSSGIPHTHALGLVRMAANQIEHRLLGQNFEGSQVLRFHSDPSMLGTLREGLLVFRDDRIVAANRRGLTLVGLGWDALDCTDFEEVFVGAGLPWRQRLRLRTTNGTEVAAEWRDAGIRALEVGLPPGPTPHDSGSAETLHGATDSLIRQTLQQCGGNVSATARRLGIHRSTVHRRLAALEDERQP